MSPVAGSTLLVYDGDCRFCRTWIDYWSRQTGERVGYAPYQRLKRQGSELQELSNPQLAESLAELNESVFRGHIQFFDEDGRRCQGAEAACEVLRRIPGKGHYAWAYRHIPGCAPLSEWVYDWVAGHRELAFGAQKLLLGERLYPPEYTQISWLFLRLLSLIYFFAFASFHVQALGLIGHDGLQPVADLILAAKEVFGDTGYWQLPTLFWWDASDTGIQALTLAGMGLSLLLLFGFLPRALFNKPFKSISKHLFKGSFNNSFKSLSESQARPLATVLSELLSGIFPGLCLLILYLLYLSLVHGGQDFMQYQWDLLLLETGLLALFLVGGNGLGRVQGKVLGVWLLRLLLFRFVFMSGAVKVLSGDPTWAGLTALEYHFQTQPLPTPLAWYAQQLPAWSLQLFTLMVLTMELLLPWLIFLGRRPRKLAAWGIVVLQLSILLTGNYNFFNLLTLTLCLLLLDDNDLPCWLRSALDWARGKPAAPEPPEPGSPRQLVWKLPKYLLGIVLGVLGLGQIFLGLGLASAPASLAALLGRVDPWYLANPYGVFAVMTTRRPEIQIEGSMDGEHWLPYSLPYKPGDPARAPLWNIPHQPRLDWQLWFAALDGQPPPPWFHNLMVNLLFNNPQVLALFEAAPFQNQVQTREGILTAQPPRLVRARLYNYRFSNRRERSDTGAWWQRREIGNYFPAVQFKIKASPLNAPEPQSEQQERQ
ncbi:lipase maturation factor family protein [Shewanella salipaludis]|uniref:Lipase maturation factor 2 n=1 Tax=Shewanella salipaludis TaxID=2723052 RepID=A0A972G743_9GAMM|nr:lipase maturation factor family protein [Shewanella salipaludis]NMH65730.1 DUF393 domain-containing protein [Shewanella salipaludis]